MIFCLFSLFCWLTFQIFFSFFSFDFFRLRLMSDVVHNFFHPSSFCSALKQVSQKRAPDLGIFGMYSLFSPLCFVSFFKFCLHPARLQYPVTAERLASPVSLEDPGWTKEDEPWGMPVRRGGGGGYHGPSKFFRLDCCVSKHAKEVKDYTTAGSKQYDSIFYQIYHM
jgi:hypothetical protein